MITCKFEDGGDGKLRHVCVNAVVILDKKILLVKRSEKLMEGGKWGLPGGFVNRDETVDEAVSRELKEETGWEGKIVSLFHINSNPQRPDHGRQNVILEYLITPTEEVSIPDWEQSEVEWHEIEALTPEMMAFDHFKTLEHVKKYLKNELSLPIIE
jgi:ADP-ribose pyrophosphatase YjhB (NUDIX family)